jgi:adenylate kinase family enzyme
MPTVPVKPPPLGRRIAVYGNSGSGKTTLARELGAALALPVVELDSIFHAWPNWQDLELPEFRAAVKTALATYADGWIMDGNYSGVRDLILASADTAIWLRLPFRTVYWRLCRRTLSRARVSAELWNGNRETWRQTLFTRDSMLLWGLTSWRRSRRNTGEALRATPHHARVIVLRTPRDVERLVARARRQHASS